MAKYHGTILYYAPAADRGDGKLTALCVRMGLRLRRVRPDELGQTVGHLAGLIGFEAQTDGEAAEPVNESMLVLCGLEERAFNELLRGLKQPGMPRIALKAMLTQTNCEWTMRALYGELCAERAGIASHESPSDGE